MCYDVGHINVFSGLVYSVSVPLTPRSFVGTQLQTAMGFFFATSVGLVDPVGDN